MGDMETFLCRWTDVLTSMEERPSELQLRDIFLDQVRKSRSELTPFVRDYENAEEGAYFKTYTYLKAGLEKRIRVKREASNRESWTKAVNGPTPVAPATDTRKGGKGNKGDSDPPGKGEPKPKRAPKKQERQDPPGSNTPDRVETRVCFSFGRTGKCNKKDCIYVHRLYTDEERKADDEARAAKGIGKGRDRSPEGKKKIPCKFFFSEAGCPAGGDCRYSHDPAVKAAADAEKNK